MAKKINAKVLYRRIENVSRKYNQYLNTNYSKLPEGVVDIEKNINFIMKVENAYNKLKDEDKEFINNEFFDISFIPWWKDKYTRKTFNYKKKIAARRFLNALHD